MPIDYQIRRLQEFTSVKLTGPATLPDFFQFINEFSEISKRHADKRVLADMLGVEHELKFTDRFQVGEHAAKCLSHIELVAAVVPESQITHTPEKVAIKLGLQLRIFSSMTEAIRWLSRNPPQGLQA